MVDPIALAVGVLADALDPVPVSTEVDFNRQGFDRLAVVTLEGMQDDGFLTTATIGLTIWGRTDRDAFGMTVAAADALRDEALTHPYLSAAQLESMARDEWTSTGQSRYFARVQLIINTDE